MDAALVACLSLLVWRAGIVGPWVLIAGGWRYGFLGLLWLFPRLAQPLPFSRRRRAVCVIQIAGLLLCLGPLVPELLKPPMAALSVLALSASFTLDIAYLVRVSKPEPVRP